MTDEELNRILPQSGYEIIAPPDGYTRKTEEAIPTNVPSDAY
jgi:hypothetical protein